MDFTILHFAIHIVWRANVICTCRKSGIARKTTVAYPELRLEALTNKNDEIRELLPLYRSSIEKLHLKEAYEHLEAIRKIVIKRSATDYELLATIDYLMGKCSRFIRGNDENAEFVRAFDEMQKANLFLTEIAEEFIYVNIKGQDKSQIIDLCNQVLNREPDNAMAHAGLVVLADDVEKLIRKFLSQFWKRLISDSSFFIMCSIILNKNG